MVIYDNEALRSAQFDIACLGGVFFHSHSLALLLSVLLFFVICLLMQVYYYRPFCHRIMIRFTSTWTKRFLFLSLSVYVSDSFFFCILLSPVHLLCIVWLWWGSHSHQIKLIPTLLLRIQIYASVQRNGATETWIAFTLYTNPKKIWNVQRQMYCRPLNIIFVCSLALSFYLCTWKINLQSETFGVWFSFVIFSQWKLIPCRNIALSCRRLKLESSTIKKKSVESNIRHWTTRIDTCFEFELNKNGRLHFL